MLVSCLLLFGASWVNKRREVEQKQHNLFYGLEFDFVELINLEFVDVGSEALQGELFDHIFINLML